MQISNNLQQSAGKIVTFCINRQLHLAFYSGYIYFGG